MELLQVLLLSNSYDNRHVLKLRSHDDGLGGGQYKRHSLQERSGSLAWAGWQKHKISKSADTTYLSEFIWACMPNWFWCNACSKLGQREHMVAILHCSWFLKAGMNVSVQTYVIRHVQTYLEDAWFVLTWKDLCAQDCQGQYCVRLRVHHINICQALCIPALHAISSCIGKTLKPRLWNCCHLSEHW